MTNSIKKYIPTIGIECHVQLKTKTKLFSAVGNDASEAPPNSLISHIDVGLPGALPVLNEAAVDLAGRAALALGTEPQSFSHFDRKHYFYPDLPKGYQITQYAQPLIIGGHVEIWVDGVSQNIDIIRAHLEEDAGKNIHPAGADYSLVDLNRAGTPLLEIVSAPDLRSAVAAKTFARELYLLMLYAGVTDGNLHLGHMRFDVNVSVSADPNKPGTRSETKNLNSFRSVEAAVEYEIKRQTELLEKGESIVQETRGWDEAKQKTTSQRSKEEAEDYRYMPEPDIPPLELRENYIKKIKKNMPELPNTFREYFQRAGISKNISEVLLESPPRARFIKAVAEKHGPEHAKRIANLVVGGIEVLTQGRVWLGAHDLLSVEKAVKLSQMVSDGKLSSTASKEIWIRMNVGGEDPEELAKTLKLTQVSDEGKIAKIVEQVIAENPEAVADVKKGEVKAIGFLVGQVMAKSKGQANPSLAQQLISQQLGL